MLYVQTFDRTQMMIYSWDSLVDSESIARLINTFVERLDLKKYHVKEVVQGRGGDTKVYIKEYQVFEDRDLYEERYLKEYKICKQGF